MVVLVAAGTVGLFLASPQLARCLVGVMVVLRAPSLAAQARPTAPAAQSYLPNESAGTAEVVRTLLSLYDRVDIVALGESHNRQQDSDLRLALVRDPAFARQVRSIIVEFASTTAQPILDRYIRGDNVPSTTLAQVWKSTSNGVWDSPIYADFFAAVREVNSKLPPDARIRVFGGDPGPTDQRDRETAAFAVVNEQVLSKHGKALLIYGAAHFYRNTPPSFGTSAELAKMIDHARPGRIFTVIPLGGESDPPPPGVAWHPPDFRKLDGAVASRMRPVLLSLQRPPFRDLSAEEFLGGGMFSCAGSGGCKSAFAGSGLTLGEMADAVIYFGPSTRANALATQGRVR
jgi:hypothetical protein